MYLFQSVFFFGLQNQIDQKIYIDFSRIQTFFFLIVTKIATVKLLSNKLRVQILYARLPIEISVAVYIQS